MAENKSDKKTGENPKKKIVKKHTKKSSFKVLLINLIVLIVLCFTMIWGIMHWLDDYTNHNNVVRVPSLENLNEAQVKSVLDSKNLRYKIVDSIHVKNKLKGVVVDQKPVVNSKAKVGRIIFLTINSFRGEFVKLPNVKDYSRRQAEAVVKAIGLKIGEPFYQESKYKGLVFGVKYRGKDIEPGRELPSGDSISLVVGN